MRIAICEDNREHTEILEDMAKRWAEKEGEPDRGRMLSVCRAVPFLYER